MARIGPKDTKPEMLLRQGLHGRGFRYGLHRRDLPGKPDLVLPKFGAVIFVNGCFWHGHTGCPHFTLPKGNQEFWAGKIGRTRERDQEAVAALTQGGWRVLTVWECTMRGKTALDREMLLDRVAEWLRGGGGNSVISGGIG